jgi:putative ABC transport system permease protein
MRLIETLRQSFASLTSNKLRSVLTVLGVVIGVFSLIGVRTIISGMQSKIEAGLSQLGANSFQIQKYPRINFTDPRRKFGNRRDITYPMAERFKELIGDSARVSLQIGRGGMRAVYLDQRTNPNLSLTGTDENFTTTSNFDIVLGRDLGADDVAFGRAVCVLGSDVREKLFPREDPLGKWVRMDGQTYTVIGVLAAKGAAIGGSQDNFVTIPITRWLMVYGRAWRSIAITVQAPGQLELPPMEDRAISAMRLVRGLNAEKPNDFEVYTNESLIEAFNQITGIVAIGALVISAIALVAAGIGVMNIMLVSVTERTKEIGIRKSIGAKKRTILLQFLIEAVVLTLIGGIVGVSCGVAGGDIFAYFTNTPLSFPWLWAGIGLAVCGGLGVVFGLYPAWKAASLDPIEALRYE